MTDILDTVVIGAGVIGLAIARALVKEHSVAVLEQHTDIGSETSARNSGVLHAGIYYPPASLKTRWCIEGRARLVDYCVENRIDHRLCGKLIVATRQDQIPALKALATKAADLGVALQWLDQQGVHDLEPEVQAVAGLYSPGTGIIDVHGLLLQLQADIERTGGFVLVSQQVTGLRKESSGFVVEINHQDEVRCRQVVNAAGLCAPEVAQMLSLSAPSYCFVKGHYFSYQGASPFQHLIYPMPEPHNLGLGVHATLDLQGRLKFGPDAVPVADWDYGVPTDLAPRFAAAIGRYFPAVDATRLQPDYAGIRPKLSIDAVADFKIQTPEEHGIPGLINLFGIESPGLTASLAIADHIKTLLAPRSCV